MTLLHHIPYEAMVSENDQLSQIRIKVHRQYSDTSDFSYIFHIKLVFKNIILKSIHVRFR